MTEFIEAPDVETVAKQVISTYPLDDKARDAKIVYLFTLEKKPGHYGKIMRPTGPWRYLSNYDYVVLIHKTSWESFTDTQKQALVYHELRHITHRLTKEQKIIWGLRDHDIEEFFEVIKNFGNWSPALQTLVGLK